MPKIYFNGKIFTLKHFENENELEKVVIENYKLIFGDNSIYFDVKKKVKSKKGGFGSIPDGYLMVFFNKSPKLFIVENEISSHDESTISNQLMRFLATFKEGQYDTKAVLMEVIKTNHEIKKSLEIFLKYS